MTDIVKLLRDRQYDDTGTRVELELDASDEIVKLRNYACVSNIVIVILMIVLTSGILSGCAVSAKHMSDPRVDNDGYNLLCGGVEYEGRCRASADVCYNLSPNHGEFILAEIKCRIKK